MKGIKAEAQTTVASRLIHKVGSDQWNDALTTSLTLERANSLGIHFPTLPKRDPIPIERWLPPKTEYPLRAVDPLTALNRRLAFPIFPESPTRAYHRDNDFFPINKPFAVGTTLPTLVYHGGLFRNDDDEVKAVSMWFLETTYARHFMAELSTLRGVLRNYIVFDNKCRGELTRCCQIEPRFQSMLSICETAGRISVEDANIC